MKKGEKLHKFLETKMDECENSPSLSPSANVAFELGYALDYLRDMPDEQFDKILNNQCRVCEKQRKLECCYDCYDEMRGEMLTRDEYI